MSVVFLYNAVTKYTDTEHAQTGFNSLHNNVEFTIEK